MSHQIAFFLRRRAQLWSAGAAVASAVLLAGCASPAPQQRVPSSTVRQLPAGTPATARHATLPWAGMYRAEAPCPAAGGGCTGQVLQLTLNPDRSYSLATTTLRRGGQAYTFTSRARFRLDADGRTITLASKDENTRLRLDGADRLVRIGRDGLNETEAARTPLVFRRL